MYGGRGYPGFCFGY